VQHLLPSEGATGRHQRHRRVQLARPETGGEPYSFLTTQPFGQVPYDSDPEDVAMGDLEGTGEVDTDRWSLSGGRICLKGQAGIQTAFDSYRVRKPMKRVGPGGRASGETISWDRAIEEIVNGDDDLGHPGLLQEMWAHAPQDEVMSDWEAVQEGAMAKSAFDSKWDDALIDTDHRISARRPTRLSMSAASGGTSSARGSGNRGWARPTASTTPGPAGFRA